MKYLISLAIFWLFYALIASPLIDAASRRVAKAQGAISTQGVISR